MHLCIARISLQLFDESGRRTKSVMKTIEIVAEGPHDFELIAALIDTITNEENSYQMIQPEPDMAGRFGNGWKGVWKWCETNQGSLNTYMNSLTPVLDFLVIHMDGDVERCEKEVHCECQRKFCDASESTHPLTCEKIANNRSDCPVVLPCEEHGNTPEHVFAVVKLQLRFRKTRYRGLQKQIAKMNIMFALANLILADRPCLAA